MLEANKGILSYDANFVLVPYIKWWPLCSSRRALHDTDFACPKEKLKILQPNRKVVACI